MAMTTITDKLSNPKEFDEALGTIVNDIKTANTYDAIQIIKSLIDNIAHQEYMQGYIDLVICLKNDLHKTAVEITKKMNRRK